MQDAGSGMHPLPAKTSREGSRDQLRSARAGRSVFMLPSALVRLRRVDMSLPDLFMSVLIASRFIDPLLLFMSVVDGMALVVEPVLEVLGVRGVAFIEPAAGAVLGIGVVELGVAGIGIAGVAG